MAEHKKINELQVNERIDDVYLLRDASLESSPKAGSYWKLLLGDASGSISAKIWSPKSSSMGEKDNWDEISRILQDKPLWVRIAGTVSEFNGLLQFTVRRVSGLSPEELEDIKKNKLHDYVQASPRSGEEMLEEIKDLCESELSYAPWKELVYSVLRIDRKDEDFSGRILMAPAAKAMHHARTGGLLQHSLSVARLCLRIAGHYGSLDRQLLLAAALLHDIGKLYEMTGPLSTEYTVEGNLLGHIAQGMMILEPFLKNSGLKPELQTHLLHLVASHHGRAEYGAVKEPMTPEALILHFADDLDARMDRFLDVVPLPDEGSKCCFVRGEKLFRFALTPGSEITAEGDKPEKLCGGNLKELEGKLAEAEARCGQLEKELEDGKEKAALDRQKLEDKEKECGELRLRLQAQQSADDGAEKKKLNRRTGKANEMWGSLFPAKNEEHLQEEDR